MAEPLMLLIFISTVGACASLLALWKGVVNTKLVRDGCAVTQEVHVMVNSEKVARDAEIDRLTTLAETMQAEINRLAEIRQVLEQEIMQLKAAISRAAIEASDERGK